MNHHIKQRIFDIVVEHIPDLPEDVNIRDVAEVDLNIDSINAVALILSLEEAFDVEFEIS